MPTNQTSDSPETLGRSQREEASAMTLADIRRQAETFQT